MSKFFKYIIVFCQSNCDLELWSQTDLMQIVKQNDSNPIIYVYIKKLHISIKGKYNKMS